MFRQAARVVSSVAVLRNSELASFFSNGSGRFFRCINRQLAASGQGRRFSLPAHQVLQMPALSPTMEAGNIAKWHVKDGDSVGEGDVIAEIETDKATLPFEMQEEGYIAKILKAEGSKDVSVGEPVAILVEDEADVAAFANYDGSTEGTTSPSSSAGDAAESAQPSSGGKPKGDWPPHQVLDMPALSPTMEQGNLVEWKVKVGDEVAAGDVLAEIETDKATLGFETQEDGFVAKLLVGSGTKDIPIGSPVIIIVDDELTVTAFESYTLESATTSTGSTSSVESSSDREAAAEPSSSTYEGARSDRIGPAARLLLQEHGLTATDITPTGPGGIVTKGDVLAAVAAGVKPSGKPAHAAEPVPELTSSKGSGKAQPPSYSGAAEPEPPGGEGAPAESSTSVGRVKRSGTRHRDIPLTSMRRVIARRLLESKQTIPFIYVARSADLDALTAARTALKEAGVKVSVNDFVVKAVGMALRAVPGVCAGWDAKREETVQFEAADVSIAVATEGGLITPIVKDADRKSLSDISAAVKDLAGRARANKLSPAEFTGGSFTVSNLGMYGIKEFCAIINPPQSSILAIGGTQSRAEIAADGALVSKSFMTVTLSADNRVVDEETAAQFLESFKRFIENPILLSGL